MNVIRFREIIVTQKKLCLPFSKDIVNMGISWLDGFWCERTHENREDILSKLTVHTCINQ